MLVTLIAAVHYFYMREYWVTIKETPIVYRYIDWSLTVPLQMIEFFLILKAVNPETSSMMFWRLLVGPVDPKTAGEFVASAFNTMRFIVTIGWSIYPLGYYFGYLMPTVSSNVLNLVYNL